MEEFIKELDYTLKFNCLFGKDDFRKRPKLEVN